MKTFDEVFPKLFIIDTDDEVHFPRVLDVAPASSNIPDQVWVTKFGLHTNM